MRAVLSAMAWQEIRAKRQAVRDARTLPARLAALCDYQGALAAFVDGHWPELEQRFGQLHIVPAANESAIAPADVAATPRSRAPRAAQAAHRERVGGRQPLHVLEGQRGAWAVAHAATRRCASRWIAFSAQHRCATSCSSSRSSSARPRSPRT
jgi:hypothetical protein